LDLFSTNRDEEQGYTTAGDGLSTYNNQWQKKKKKAKSKN
jgi:hypothetical protein